MADPKRDRDAENLRTRQQLDATKKKTVAQTEAGKQPTIDYLVRQANAARQQASQLENQRKAQGTLTDAQKTQAKQLDDQIKKELTQQNTLIKNNKQRYEDVQHTKSTEKLAIVLLVAAAYQIKRRHNANLAELLEEEEEEEAQQFAPRKKPDDGPEVDPDKDQQKSPGKMLSDFIALMRSGLELTPEFNIQHVRPDGKLQLTDRRGRALDPDEYLKDVLAKFSPKPTPGGAKKLDEDQQQAQTQSRPRSSIPNPGATPKLEIKGG